MNWLLNQRQADKCVWCLRALGETDEVYEAFRFCDKECLWNFYVLMCPYKGCTGQATETQKGSPLAKQCTKNSTHKWVHCSKARRRVATHENCDCKPGSLFDFGEKQSETKTSDPVDAMLRILDEDDGKMQDSLGKVTINASTKALADRLEKLRLQKRATRLSEKAEAETLQTPGLQPKASECRPSNTAQCPPTQQPVLDILN